MKNKILVTGSGGFIGSHLTEFLIRKGYTVRAFVRYNSNNNWGWLDNSSLKNDIEIYQGDIRDYDSVFRAMKDCHSVFHLSALIGIPYSYLSPLAYLQTNVVGTYNVLQSSRELNLEEIIITSTSETYGSAQYTPIDELHPLVGQSPYSASKIGADNLAMSYYHSFDLPIKIVRPFNTYGPRQSARAFIPTVISQGLNDEKIKLGNLFPTRDLTFVKDTVSGFYAIFKCQELKGQVTNIGMRKEISMAELSKLILKLLGKEIMIEEENIRIRPRASEVDRLVCDNSKIMKQTNWSPTFTLEQGIEETIKWLKENKDKYKYLIYNV